MHTEVRTRIKTTGKYAPELIMEVLLLPRGGGNRRMARKLATQFCTNKHLAEHVRRVVCGTSKVTVHFISSMKLMQVVMNWSNLQHEGDELRDVPGQMMLPGVAVE